MWLAGYILVMYYQLKTTAVFNRWLGSLRDRVAARAIAARLDRVAAGNLGDTKSLGGGLSEMRIFIGPGYRIYYTVRGRELVILLCGGDKTSQPRDLRRANLLISQLERE